MKNSLRRKAKTRIKPEMPQDENCRGIPASNYGQSGFNQALPDTLTLMGGRYGHGSQRNCRDGPIIDFDLKLAEQDVSDEIGFILGDE